MKKKFRWPRGKAKDRIKRQRYTNKGINFDSKKIRPGDIYYKNDNWVKIAMGNPGSINGKEEIIYTTVCLKIWICFLTETWVKDEDCDSVNRLRKAGYCFRNIPREDKRGGGTDIICRDRYNPSLVSKGRHVTFEFSQWQINIGIKTVSILIVYRPPYSRSSLYTGFKFVEESGDFLGDRLKNTKMIMGEIFMWRM